MAVSLVASADLEAYAERIRVDAAMNFYPRHVGDYTTATTHLTMLEDGAFNRLLDHYYSRERPLPVSIVACCRIARAFTKAEREAVASVLGQFFTLEAAGYTNRRCNAEIAAYNRKREKARESALAGWAPDRKRKREKAPERERSADEEAPAMRTHSEGNATRARPSNQYPVSKENNLQSVGHSEGPTDGFLRGMAEEACRRMAAAGCSTVNPSDDDLIQALLEEVTPEELEDCARYTVDSKKAHSNAFRYAITTARDHHARRTPPGQAPS